MAVAMILSIVAAYIYNRYATRIYPVTASVIVKEAEDISGDLLYNNPLVNFRRNYLNEIYILKSYPLIQRVIEDLNFDATFYREGNILTTEAYDKLPIEVITDRKHSTKSTQYVFRVVDASTFTLETQAKDNKIFGEFRFGDTIVFNGFKGTFILTEKESVESLKNSSLLFAYTPSAILTHNFVTSLKADWAEEGAGVINLSFNGPDPRKIKDFLEGLIFRYQENDLENKTRAATRAVNFISEQLTDISDSLRQVELQLQAFKSKNVVTDLTGEALRLYEKIEAIETQKSQLIVNENYYQYLDGYINNNQNLDQVILPASMGIADPVLSGLVTQMTDLQLELNLATKAENPLVENALQSINKIKRDIVEAVKSLRATDNIKLKFLNKQVSGIEKQLAFLPLEQRNLISIQRNYTLLENLYLFLLQKRSEAGISKASSISDIMVVNSPRAGEAVSPKKSQNYILAIAFGISIPLIIFVLLEFMETRVQSREDIEKLTNIPFIGGVGHKKISNNLEVFGSPKTAIAESFRALRSNLSYFVGKNEKAVFMITSSISGEGKTFSSINLASVLALSRKRTLIVGADMRKPKIYNDFKLSNDRGLSTYLAGMNEFDDVVQHTPFENLDLVSGGPVPPNPSELLLTTRMEAFITEAKKRYDYIIIDTPPLAIVTDAFVLSQYSDHTLFLVRQNYTPKDLLKTAHEFYASGRLKNISIVLNDIYKSGPGYGYSYGYGYGYAYGYGHKNGAGYYE